MILRKLFSLLLILSMGLASPLYARRVTDADSQADDKATAANSAQTPDVVPTLPTAEPPQSTASTNPSVRLTASITRNGVTTPLPTTTSANAAGQTVISGQLPLSIQRVMPSPNTKIIITSITRNGVTTPLSTTTSVNAAGQTVMSGQIPLSQKKLVIVNTNAPTTHTSKLKVVFKLPANTSLFDAIETYKGAFQKDANAFNMFKALTPGSSLTDSFLFKVPSGYKSVKLQISKDQTGTLQVEESASPASATPLPANNAMATK